MRHTNTLADIRGGYGERPHVVDGLRACAAQCERQHAADWPIPSGKAGME